MIQEKYRVHRNYYIYSIYSIILFSATVAEEELRDASLEQVEIQFPATEHLRHLKHETSLLTIQLVLSPCVWGVVCFYPDISKVSCDQQKVAVFGSLYIRALPRVGVIDLFAAFKYSL